MGDKRPKYRYRGACIIHIIGNKHERCERAPVPAGMSYRHPEGRHSAPSLAAGFPWTGGTPLGLSFLGDNRAGRQGAGFGGLSQSEFFASTPALSACSWCHTGGSPACSGWRSGNRKTEGRCPEAAHPPPHPCPAAVRPREGHAKQCTLGVSDSLPVRTSPSPTPVPPTAALQSLAREPWGVLLFLTPAAPR